MKPQLNRRQFVQNMGVATLGALALPTWADDSRDVKVVGNDVGVDAKPLGPGQKIEIPSYLEGYEEIYRHDPKAAAVEWHRHAKWGLLIHYALGSLSGITAQQAIEIKKRSVAEWKKTKNAFDYKAISKQFTAEKFDADFITDLALEAEMKYVNFTTRHIGGMFMFRTSQSEFTSLNSPARRDLVEELAVQCEKKKLGLFIYCPPDMSRTEPQDTFERNQALIKELLTQYGPVAGMWFDSIGAYYSQPEAYARLPELYALIRSLQPQCLISFKQGTGIEDFVAPEELMHAEKGALAEKAWQLNRMKRGDICTMMQTAPPSWLYLEGCEYFNAKETLALLADAFAQAANLTMNVGPLPDGSLHPEEITALREAGALIRKHGFPVPKLMDRKVRQEMKRIK